MPTTSKRYVLFVLAVVFVLGVAVLVLGGKKANPPAEALPVTEEVVAAPTPKSPRIRVVGHSVGGRAIEQYSFGEGKTHLLFVGGMHGGYEWNSVVLAYEFIDYLGTPLNVPEGFTISVIPSANPDGVFDVVGKEGKFTANEILNLKNKPVGYGRLNAHSVDLNRNFDCNWKPSSMWRGTKVAAGSAPFSEPESAAIRDAVASDTPSAVIFWHSQSGSVYASECNKGILPDTLSLMDTYAKAAGYTPVKKFDAYVITGDAEGWLASIGIPAITVELTTHETVEWKQNLAGIKAILDYYKQKNQ